jgi:hypothetical protein
MKRRSGLLFTQTAFIYFTHQLVMTTKEKEKKKIIIIIIIIIISVTL